MIPEPQKSLSFDAAERLARLEPTVALLEQALHGLDALEMNTTATHVSMGFEMAKAELEKLRNEANRHSPKSSVN